MHQSHFCLYHDIVSSPFPIRTCLAIPRNACVYEARVDLADGVIVHTVFLEGIREVVFDQNIAVFGKLVEDLDAGPLLEGET